MQWLKAVVNTCLTVRLVLYDISQLLNTQLDKETLALCVTMIESGVNPEALAVSHHYCCHAMWGMDQPDSANTLGCHYGSSARESIATSAVVRIISISLNVASVTRVVILYAPTVLHDLGPY